MVRSEQTKGAVTKRKHIMTDGMIERTEWMVDGWIDGCKGR